MCHTWDPEESAPCSARMDEGPVASFQFYSLEAEGPTAVGGRDASWLQLWSQEAHWWVLSSPRTTNALICHLHMSPLPPTLFLCWWKMRGFWDRWKIILYFDSVFKHLPLLCKLRVYFGTLANAWWMEPGNQKLVIVPGRSAQLDFWESGHSRPKWLLKNRIHPQITGSASASSINSTSFTSSSLSLSIAFSHCLSLACTCICMSVCTHTHVQIRWVYWITGWYFEHSWQTVALNTQGYIWKHRGVLL